MPSPTVEVLGDHEGGAILAALIQTDDSGVALIERDGTIAWAVESTEKTIPSWVQFLDDDHVIHNEHYRNRNSSGGAVVLTTLSTGEVVETRAPFLHHTGLVSGDTVAYVKAEFRELEWEGELQSVASDALVLRNLGDEDGEGKRLYSFFEDWGGDLFKPCRHFDNFVYYSDKLDWTHSNSLVELPDHWVMEARHWDALLGINKASGEVDWILGGDFGDWSRGPDSAVWSHPHVSQMTEEVLVTFDNGDHREPRKSRAVVYDLDLDAKTYTERFRIGEEDGQFLPLLGDAQLLPGGNLLISWSELGRVDEYTPEGELVWRMELPLGTVVGRVDHRP